MLLFFTEDDVKQYLTMETAIEAVEQAFGDLAQGEGYNFPRTRIPIDTNKFHFMASSLPGLGFAGIKIYTTFEGRPTTNMLLYSTQTGRMLAMFESWTMSAIRTGAATAVATKYMARQNATRVGLYGSGAQAMTQLEAVAAVRPIEQCLVYSRTPAHRERFAELARARLEIDVRATAEPAAAAREQDIIITATDAHDPVLKGEWLEKGVHLNVIGSNQAENREVDEKAVLRSQIIAADSVEQSKRESGDLIYPIERGLLSWDDVVELSRIVVGLEPGRTNDEEITFFKSNGINIEDVAVAAHVYKQYRQGSSHLSSIPPARA